MNSILFFSIIFLVLSLVFGCLTAFYARITKQRNKLFNESILALKFIHFLVNFIEEYLSEYYLAIDYLC